MIRGGNDLQRFRRERRVHATRPGGRGHARLEFSEKLVHCGTRYRVPTRVRKMCGASKRTATGDRDRQAGCQPLSPKPSSMDALASVAVPKPCHGDRSRRGVG